MGVYEVSLGYNCELVVNKQSSAWQQELRFMKWWRCMITVGFIASIVGAVINMESFMSFGISFMFANCVVGCTTPYTCNGVKVYLQQEADGVTLRAYYGGRELCAGIIPWDGCWYLEKRVKNTLIGWCHIHYKNSKRPISPINKIKIRAYLVMLLSSNSLYILKREGK